MARIVELLYYPIKGCAGISADDAMLTMSGLANDRSFMVTSEQGVFRTQRRDPRLALIRGAISFDGKRLTLRAPGREPLGVEVDTTGPRRHVELFKTSFKGIDQGHEAARWMSAFLGVPSRLVRVPPEHDRVTDGLTPGTSGFADSCAVHLLSQSTLDLLNNQLAKRRAAPLPMNRFRPNIVVGGWEESHVEDRARRIGIGEAELGYAKPAIRCSVTMIDQEAGARAGPEPLRTLASYRRAAAGGLAFGSKLAVLRPGKLSVGDEVNVSAWGQSEL